MLNRSGIIVLVTGLLIGAVAGLVVGYGIHDAPAQGSIGSVQSAGDGYFLVNGQKMDLGALQLMLQIDRTKALDQSIADQMAQIQDRNKQIRDYNEQMANLTAQRAALDQNDSKYKENYASLTAQIDYLKGLIDGLNSEAQLDMIRLQSLIDKRNQAFEMASNTLQQDQKTRDSIVGNLR
ncbi:hypothetical protein [Methanocella sp. MCL-LM]|uniref:hypothetical protein n=1 Tax=Methanocella sp. MCL-LM TaxID=3412035 RepID=UPI003C76302F